MINLQKLTIKTAREALRKGEFTARELAEASLKAIEEKNGELNAFIEVYDDVLDQANEADQKLLNLQTSELPNLLGIPLALKDNILVEGKKASAGSKILEGYTATYDATAVRKLREAGAVLVGRTNMDEFAMGSSTESSVYGPTRNPHDTSRVPGGSSGGSAVAVASGMVLGALGSDTGGSVRQPAAFCGVVGMKPTYGRVSRSGLIAYGSSLDQIGSLAKTVEDAELIYGIIKGQDSLDSTTIADDTYSNQSFSKKVGIPRSFVESEGVNAEVKNNFAEVEARFASLGYEIVDLDLEHLKYSLSAYYIIALAEASSNLARFDGVKYGLHVEGETGIEDYFKTRGKGFGREVRRRIILGTHVLSSGYYDEYYGSAVKMKRFITDEFNKAFEKVDFILTPTTPTPAFKIGEKVSDPLAMYLADIFTVPANIAGIPSISIPSGTASLEGKDLPLGIELTAGAGQEENLFRTAKDFLNE